MQRDNIIILTRDDNAEAWGSLTEVCKNHSEFSYHYLKQKKYPFTYKGVRFVKVPFRNLNGV